VEHIPAQPQLSRSILVRDCGFFGLPQYIRVSAKLPEQNQRLINALAEVRASLEIIHSMNKRINHAIS
jgi:histidinol-phosphate/aromatic aminotransferase/cobyric acid decarboxylase-like protein